MKITSEQLKRIIKEELNYVLNEERKFQQLGLLESLNFDNPPNAFDAGNGAPLTVKGMQMMLKNKTGSSKDVLNLINLLIKHIGKNYGKGVQQAIVNGIKNSGPQKPAVMFNLFKTAATHKSVGPEKVRELLGPSESESSSPQGSSTSQSNDSSSSDAMVGKGEKDAQMVKLIQRKINSLDPTNDAERISRLEKRMEFFK